MKIINIKSDGLGIDMLVNVDNVLEINFGSEIQRFGEMHNGKLYLPIQAKSFVYEFLRNKSFVHIEILSKREFEKRLKTDFKFSIDIKKNSDIIENLKTSGTWVSDKLDFLFILYKDI